MTDFILYKTPENKISINVQIEDETVWLTQDQTEELFSKSKKTISEYTVNIFSKGELSEHSVVRNFQIAAADGKNYEVKHYNLDIIMSVGYRVRSLRGIQFHQWATRRLREYIIKGFTMDDASSRVVGVTFER